MKITLIIRFLVEYKLPIYRLKITMGSFVRKTLPLMLVLLSVTRQRAKYLVPYTKVCLDANLKQLVFLDPKIPMVNTALAILSAKNNAN